MLEQLFGSKTRVRLLRLFLHNPKGAYFVRELTRRIGAQINAVRNELGNLVELGLVEVSEAPVSEAGAEASSRGAGSKQKKFYRLNADALIVPELRALFLKARMLLEKDFINRLSQTGSIGYLALTGQFSGLEQAPTDILIVGRVNRDRLASLIRGFEREVGKEVNYTVFTPQEFKYRKDVTDKFLYSILESPKMVVVDRLTEFSALPA